MLLITPVASFQDNQTDSGMVLASEEFERIENRHRKEGGFRYSLSLATAAKCSETRRQLLVSPHRLHCLELSAVGPEPDKSMYSLMRGKTQEEQTSLLFSRV